MTHRERLETAWSFREPDRVPIELRVSESARKHPLTGRLNELIAEHTDNFGGAGGPDYGFFGFPAEGREEVIEDRPGEFKRVRRTQVTEAGTFTAVTYHPHGTPDHHWEKRFVSSLDDLHRLAETPRKPLSWDYGAWQQASARCEENDLVPLTGIPHPLGRLVRNATMEEMYAWFYEESQLVHRFLEASNAQVAESVATMVEAGAGPYFSVCAHEMLLPPWMGRRLFDEFVLQYDKEVYRAIRENGGKLRAHCHGNCMEYLEAFYEMGLDAIEPLEQPPMGDVDLAEAKRKVGDRMMLCGNVPSERFVEADPQEVASMVRKAIYAMAPGGGFTLRTSGGAAGTQIITREEHWKKAIRNCEVYVETALECGQYPIRPTNT